MTKLTHANILANAWTLYAADVMVRIVAMFADEERQMRECMSNRDNYDIEGIQSVIAYHEKNGWTRRADIARAILAERLAEAEADTNYAEVPYNEDGINEDGQNVFFPGAY